MYQERALMRRAYTRKAIQVKSHTPLSEGKDIRKQVKSVKHCCTSILKYIE